MVFLFYKFLFFLSDFLEIQRKSFYLFLNELLSQEFLKIQPLYNFRKRTIYKNLKLPSRLVCSADLGSSRRLDRGSESPIQSPPWSSTNLFERALGEAPVKKTGASPLNFAGPADWVQPGLDKAGSALINNPLEGLGLRPGSKPPINKKISPTGSSLRLDIAPRTTPKDPTNDRITTIYFLSNNYKFIKPTLNIEESILFSKTYCCHFYIPVKLLDNSTHFTEIRWIFLGTLPLLTRRGHFIINGTPRIVLNQIVRSPGIYFHKGFSRKKGSPLFYAEIISKSGPWVRLEIDQKKRIWVSFQQLGLRPKTKNPLSHFFRHFYQKYLDHHIFLNEKKNPTLDAILLNEFFWKDVFFKEPKNKIEANIQIYPNKLLGHPAEGWTGPHQRRRSARPVWSAPLTGGPKTHPLFFSKNRWLFCPSQLGLRPLKPQLKLGSFGHYYPVQNDTNILLHRPIAAKVSPPSGRTTQKQKLNFKSAVQPKAGPDILFASSSKNADLGLNLSPSGRMRLNQRLGLSLKTLTLTPIDFLTISDILYRWVQDGHHPNIMAEKIPLDDIDDLKNRRLKTIGELLQNQLARGIQRLQKTFENTVQKDWIKFLNDQTYHSSLSFLNDFNLNRKKNGPLASAKRTGENQGHPFHYQPTSHKLFGFPQGGSPTLDPILKYYFSKGVVQPSAGPKLTPEGFRERVFGAHAWYLWAIPNRRQVGWSNQGQSSPLRSNALPKTQTWQRPELHNPKTGLEPLTNDPNIFKKHNFEKRNFYLQQIRKIHIFKNRTFECRFGSSQRLDPKQLYYLAKAQFKRNFLWKELFLYQKTVQPWSSRLDQNLSVRARPGPNPTLVVAPEGGNQLSTSILSIINSLPINSTFKEFFHSHQLSQFLDQSNPLSEITHKRRLSCLGSGGITRETAGMEIRGIHFSHYGRICPIETPEGKNAGLVNSLTTTVHVHDKGFLETPYVEIYKQHYQNQKKLMFFSVENQELKKVFLNPKLPKLRNISVGIIKPQTQNFYKLKINYINLVAFHPIQFLSIATTCIPFIEHDDANRALMGSNMQRQALPLIYLEQPMVTTLNAFRVLSDLKDIPITPESGMILYVSQQKISYYVGGFAAQFKKKVQTVDLSASPTAKPKAVSPLGDAWAKDLKLPYRLKVHPRLGLRPDLEEPGKGRPRRGQQSRRANQQRF